MTGTSTARCSNPPSSVFTCIRLRACTRLRSKLHRTKYIRGDVSGWKVFANAKTMCAAQLSSARA